MQQDTGITQLIDLSRNGDKDAEQQLFQIVYDELRRIARRSRFVSADGGTMQPTALANEAYLVLAERFPLPPNDQRESRVTFFRTVAQAMRLILRNHWRSKQAEIHGGGKLHVELRDDDTPADSSKSFEVIEFLALDEAVTRLEEEHPRLAELVMHRHFAGRSIAETAELMDLGVTTIKTDWQVAKAWLRRELKAAE